MSNETAGNSEGEGLTAEELEAEGAIELPGREMMSVIGAMWPVPAAPAMAPPVAAKAASQIGAEQSATVDQAADAIDQAQGAGN
jgi:hypothetical protein